MGRVGSCNGGNGGAFSVLELQAEKKKKNDCAKICSVEFGTLLMFQLRLCIDREHLFIFFEICCPFCAG